MDLTGEWHGEFSYPARLGPTTPFIARIEERAGRLAGTIIEPNIVQGGTIASAIAGLRHGSAVDFVKSYSGCTTGDYDMPVDYVGSVSADGNVVRGVWSLLEMDGSFEMRREAVLAEVSEREAHVRVTVSAGGG